jgi:hypothetical protein
LTENCQIQFFPFDFHLPALFVRRDLGLVDLFDCLKFWHKDIVINRHSEEMSDKIQKWVGILDKHERFDSGLVVFAFCMKQYNFGQENVRPSCNRAADNMKSNVSSNNYPCLFRAGVVFVIGTLEGPRCPK